MSLREYFEEIESFEFGAQFAVYSGFNLVLSDMAENETLQKLIGELRSDQHKQVALGKHIQFLSRNRQPDDQIAFDGSLTSYLYCLWKADPDLGYRACQDILEVPGLWWSAKLALLVRKDFLADQISKSVQFRSEKGEPFSFALTGCKSPSFKSLGKHTYFLSGLEALPEITRQFEYKQAFNERVEIHNVSLLSSSGNLCHNDISNPTQEFEISIAI